MKLDVTLDWRLVSVITFVQPWYQSLRKDARLLYRTVQEKVKLYLPVEAGEGV